MNAQILTGPTVAWKYRALQSSMPQVPLITKIHHTSTMRPHRALLQEYLIEQVLFNVQEECPNGYIAVGYTRQACIKATAYRMRDPNPFRWVSTGRTCLHTDTLANCASVSRFWNGIANRILWGYYAGYKELMDLMRPPQNPGGPENNVCGPSRRFKPLPTIFIEK